MLPGTFLRHLSDFLRLKDPQIYDISSLIGRFMLSKCTKYHFCWALLQIQLEIPTFHYLAKQQHYIHFYRFSFTASSVDSSSLFLMFWLTLYLPPSRSTRQLSWTSAPSSTWTGNSPRRRSTTFARCSSNPTTPSHSPTFASFGTSWRGRAWKSNTRANFEPSHDSLAILSDSFSPKLPVSCSATSTQVCFKALCGKQEVRKVFWSLLQTCSVTSLGSLWRRTPLTRLLCVFYNVTCGSRRSALRSGDVTGRCEAELTRIPGAVSDFRLACGCCHVVAGRPDTKAPWSPPGGWLYMLTLGSCLLLFTHVAAGWQAALWVKAVRGLNKED